MLCSLLDFNREIIWSIYFSQTYYYLLFKTILKMAELSILKLHVGLLIEEGN